MEYHAVSRGSFLATDLLKSFSKFFWVVRESATRARAKPLLNPVCLLTRRELVRVSETNVLRDARPLPRKRILGHPSRSCSSLATYHQTGKVLGTPRPGVQPGRRR